VAHPHVIATVRTAIDSSSLDQSAVPVKQVNEDQSLPDLGGPFIMLQYPVSQTRRVSLGDRYYEETGGMRIVINVPRGIGIAAATDWSEILTDLFRDVTYDGVIFGIPTSPFMDDTNDEGSYFVATVVVPYTYRFRD
jgi:hypothetical protein